MKEYGYSERTVGHILEDKAGTIGEKIYFLHGDQKVAISEFPNERKDNGIRSVLGF